MFGTLFTLTFPLWMVILLGLFLMYKCGWLRQTERFTEAKFPKYWLKPEEITAAQFTGLGPACTLNENGTKCIFNDLVPLKGLGLRKL